MQSNPPEISVLIKQRIEGLVDRAEVRTQGTIVSLTDGIVRIHDLSDVMQGEMLESRDLLVLSTYYAAQGLMVAGLLPAAPRQGA